LVIFTKEIPHFQVNRLDFDPNLDRTLLWPFRKKWLVRKLIEGKWNFKNQTKIWIVTLEKEDFESQIHLLDKSWFSDGETLLSICAKRMYEEKPHKFWNNTEILKANLNYWLISGRKKEGPFVLIDGSHRALALYINCFIEKTAKFKPITKVVCGLSKEKGILLFDVVDTI